MSDERGAGCLASFLVLSVVLAIAAFAWLWLHVASRRE